ncbi:MAG: tryptophan 7-halogenase [Planctomycetes bacterium]|nr:tryptophan 7-halogenase [Planctomycetota bacterium]
MTSIPDTVDVLIVGGGPAGAICAGLLARQSLRVLLVDDGRPRRASEQETILPAARTALARVGVHDAVLAAAAPDRLRHLAIWGGPTMVAQPAAEPGLRLHRPTFDAGLRRWAVDCGVVLLSSCSPAAPLPPSGRVRLRFAGGCFADVEAGCVVVAAGRSGGPSPAPVLVAGPETAAFCVRTSAVPEFAEAAVIEAVPDGWLWWIPAGDGSGVLSVLVDTAVVAAEGSRTVLARALQSATGPARQVANVRLLHATRATARLRRGTDALLRLGDAIATVDPLSSQGVEKAIASADQAAAAIATLLSESADAGGILTAVWRWERDLWRAHAATAAAFYRQEERFAEQPFWRARRVPSPTVLPDPPADLPLHLASDATAATTWRRHERRLVAADGLTRPGLDDVLTHVRFVPVPPVAAAFTVPRTLAAGVAEAGRDPRLFVLPPRAVLDAALVLWRQGLLIPAATAVARR